MSLTSAAASGLFAKNRMVQPGAIDAKPAQLISAFGEATQSGDLNALKLLLASDVRVVMDGGGKVKAAQGVIDGDGRVARFLVDAKAELDRQREAHVRSRRRVSFDWQSNN